METLFSHLANRFTSQSEVLALLRERSWRMVTLVAIATVLSSSGPAQARYRTPKFDKIPLTRLIANLQRLVEKYPDSPGFRHNLARTFAMAYAKKLITVDAEVRVDTFAAEGGDVFAYNRSPPFGPLPWKVQPAATKEAEASARGLLDKAIAHYDAALSLYPTPLARGSLSILLGRAWCIEQTGDRQQAEKAYREILAAAKEQQPKGYSTDDQAFHEAAIYLAELLDPTKDAPEIKNLRKLAKRYKPGKYRGRLRSPLVVPLAGDVDGTEVIDTQARVSFDLDGSEMRQQWQWISTDVAWLVYDPFDSQDVTSGTELFGNVTFDLSLGDGYEALCLLDDDGDGRVAGDELRGLSLWHDVNSNGRCDAGEVTRVSSPGIVSLSCESTMHAAGFPYSPRGVVFDDGEVRATFDVILEVADGVEPPPEDAATD